MLCENYDTRSKSLRPIAHVAKSPSLASARTPTDKATFQAGVQLGRAMANLGWDGRHRCSNGFMEAGHIGAGRENSMGLNIMLPFEQSSNSIIDGDPKLVTMNTSLAQTDVRQRKRRPGHVARRFRDTR